VKRRPHQRSARPRDLVEAVSDGDARADRLRALRAAGIPPRLTMRSDRADAELARLDPRCRRFGQF
jgi:hypothetical protein